LTQTTMFMPSIVTDEYGIYPTLCGLIYR
jgi:hypothetical protein